MGGDNNKNELGGMQGLGSSKVEGKSTVALRRNNPVMLTMLSDQTLNLNLNGGT